MIYLLRSFGRNNKTILKVGYASNLDYRFYQYLSHNPFIELITKREGDIIFETKLHLYLHFLGYGEWKDEWYSSSNYKDILQLFHMSERRLDRNLWKNRDNIFSTINFNRKNDNSILIYTNLLSKFGKNIIPINYGKLKCNALAVDRKFYKYYSDSYSLKFFPKLYKIKQDIINNLSNIEITEEVDIRLNEFANDLENTGIFENKMELIYNNQDLLQYPLIQSILPLNIQNYITLIGLDKMKALKFVESSIKEYIESLSNLESNKDSIISLFEVGKRYTKAEIKQTLKNFYASNGISKTPKASDLEEYFEMRVCQIVNKETGKRDNGFEILKLK